MKQYNQLIILVTTLCLLSISACRSHQNTESGAVESTDSIEESIDNFISYKNTLFCIPSPLQMNYFIKKEGISPEYSFVNKVENISSYSSSCKKAINLGVFGTDLGYLNIFMISEHNSAFLQGMKRLVNDLGLEQAYDKDLEQKINRAINDRDSLYTILAKLNNNSNLLLRANSRDELSTLMVCGGYLESLYLLSKHYQKSKNTELENILYQQKYPIEFIIKILAPYYKTNTEISELEDKLVDLAYDYDVIEYKYLYEKPVYRVINNVYVFGNSSQRIDNPSNLETIISKIEKIRNGLIQ